MVGRGMVRSGIPLPNIPLPFEDRCRVGRPDRHSLRLDGPTEVWTLTGSSYFTGGYAKKVRVNGWVKT